MISNRLVKSRWRNIIEFVGPAGVGKTTLVKAIIAQSEEYEGFEDAYVRAVKKALIQQKDLVLPDPGHIRDFTTRFFKTVFPLSLKLTPNSLKKYNASTFSRISGLSEKMITVYHSRYPHSAENVTNYLMKYTENEERISKVLNMFILHVERYMCIENHLKEKLILVPGGFVHLVTSIFAPPNPKEELLEKDVQKYIENIPIPEKIIYLKADPDTCVSRMKNRGEGFPYTFKGLGEKEMKENIRSSIDCLDVAVQSLDLRDEQVIEVDAKKDIDQLVREIDPLL